MKRIFSLLLIFSAITNLYAQKKSTVPKGGGKGGKGSETVITLGERTTSNKVGKGGKGAGGETVITLGAGVQYFIPTSTQNSGTTPFLLLKNAQSVGLELSYSPKKTTTRLKLSVDYIFGTNDESTIAAFAKTQDIVYTKTSFTKSKPSGFSIMTSPQFALFPKSRNKKLPLLWVDIKFGALFGNQQTLQFFNVQSNPSKEFKSNSVSFVYNPSFIINVVKTKKLFLNLKAGYSNFGGFAFGLNITESNCQGYPCCRNACPYCTPCATESNNIINQ